MKTAPLNKDAVIMKRATLIMLIVIATLRRFVFATESNDEYSVPLNLVRTANDQSNRSVKTRSSAVAEKLCVASRH